MGLFGKLFAPGGDTIKGAMEGAGTLAKDIRSAITGEISPEKKAEIELKVTELNATLAIAQMEINKAEAGSPSLFVAGWRPGIGWICAIALGINYIVNPIADWALKIAGKEIALPAMDLSQLFPLVIALLGLGVYRTVEKVKDVHGNH